jgi:hypothetical protein
MLIMCWSSCCSWQLRGTGRSVTVYSIETSLIFELFPFCDNFNEPRQVAVTLKTRTEYIVWVFYFNQHIDNGTGAHTCQQVLSWKGWSRPVTSIDSWDWEFSDHFLLHCVVLMHRGSFVFTFHDNLKKYS